MPFASAWLKPRPINAILAARAAPPAAPRVRACAVAIAGIRSTAFAGGREAA